MRYRNKHAPAKSIRLVNRYVSLRRAANAHKRSDPNPHLGQSSIRKTMKGFSMYKVSIGLLFLLGACAMTPQETPSAASAAQHNAAEAGGDPGTIGAVGRPLPLTADDKAAAASRRKALENSPAAHDVAGAE
jgi:hypothetical protein